MKKVSLPGVGPGRRFRFFASLFLLLSLVSCSDRKTPPPPKAQPELLLEVYDASRRHDYKVALSKIRKMRSVNSTNVFLAEVESNIRFNLLTADVNKYLQIGNFDAALYAIQRYETLYGFSESTTEAKNRLFVIVELDALIGRAQNTVKSSELENLLDKIANISKEMELSPKIKNFLQEKLSTVKNLRKIEKDRVLFGLRADSLALLRTGDKKTASALVAVYAIESPDDPGLHELLSSMTAFYF